MDFCIYIHKGYWSIMYSFCDALVWLWYQCNTDSEFILLGSHWAFWMCRLVFSTKLGKFVHEFFKYSFCFFSPRILIIHMLINLMVSDRTQTSFIFFIFFFLFLRLENLDWLIFKFTNSSASWNYAQQLYRIFHFSFYTLKFRISLSFFF